MIRSEGKVVHLQCRYCFIMWKQSLLLPFVKHHSPSPSFSIIGSLLTSNITASNMFSFCDITLPFHRQKSQTNSYKKDGVSKLKQCGLNQRSPARSGKAKPKLRLAQGSANGYYNNAPCKGKSIHYQHFCPYRVLCFGCITPRALPGLGASAPSVRTTFDFWHTLPFICFILFISGKNTQIFKSLP